MVIYQFSRFQVAHVQKITDIFLYLFRHNFYKCCSFPKIFRPGVGYPGADPGFRRGGGVRTFRRGGFVQEFQERIQIVSGSWANQQAKKIADSRRGGGGSDHPKKKPVSAHDTAISFYCEKHFQNVHFCPHFF